MTQALDLLVASAPHFDITLLQRDAESATFDVPAAGPGGRARIFRIKVSGGGAPAVREIDGALPSFCPERHINSDASFCLGWGEDAAPEVSDGTTAEVWWGRVLAFLRLQLRADKARRWTGPQWAHGSAAAYQARAENAASGLGDDVLDDLRQRRISVEWSKRKAATNGRILSVRRRGKVWFSVWDSKDRVINKQQPCVCTKGCIRNHRRLRNCANHAQLAYVLARSLVLWEESEKQFWAAFKGTHCCGTMDACPLRATATSQKDS